MKTAIKKPVKINYFTFDEFVQYMKENSSEPHWHLEYNGYPISHENDECYLITTLEGTHHFTPKDVLIVGVKGEIYPCKIDIFENTYDLPPSEEKKEIKPSIEGEKESKDISKPYWAIEKIIDGYAHWWTGLDDSKIKPMGVELGDWSSNIHSCMKYATKDKAEDDLMFFINQDSGAYITEHLDM